MHDEVITISSSLASQSQLITTRFTTSLLSFTTHPGVGFGSSSQTVGRASVIAGSEAGANLDSKNRPARIGSMTSIEEDQEELSASQSVGAGAPAVAQVVEEGEEARVARRDQVGVHVAKTLVCIPIPPSNNCG